MIRHHIKIETAIMEGSRNILRIVSSSSQKQVDKHALQEVKWKILYLSDKWNDDEKNLWKLQEILSSQGRELKLLPITFTLYKSMSLSSIRHKLNCKNPHISSISSSSPWNNAPPNFLRKAASEKNSSRSWILCLLLIILSSWTKCRAPTAVSLILTRPCQNLLLWQV